ncbi:hypothetical protein DFH07DRAFT_1032492 [Mycena maculata]|uniref:Uncharacterized protein n=1 Tax=Mycena maculata TaxID=230809 RepID=A0AAD7IVW9_9AGAR|nr:hypothetical protein DFH07DRAFT_1032492 [Mycena maculata]
MASPLLDLEPLLPPEIEQEIFQLSVLSDSRVIPRLILVAHRVKLWIISIDPPPHLRILSTHPPTHRNQTKHHIPVHTLLKALESRPVSFWHDHTRYLSLGMQPGEHMGRILSMCSGTSNLALWNTDYDFRHYSKFLPLIAAMPLVRLSVHLEVLFGRERSDFSHPMFARITHLDLLDIGPYQWWEVGLGHLPCLTYISFNFPRSWYPSADEPRSVLIGVDLVKGLEIGAEVGEDRWVMAERFIKQRQSGEISAREYAIFPPQGDDEGVIDGNFWTVTETVELKRETAPIALEISAAGEFTDDPTARSVSRTAENNGLAAPMKLKMSGHMLRMERRGTSWKRIKWKMGLRKSRYSRNPKASPTPVGHLVHISTAGMIRNAGQTGILEIPCAQGRASIVSVFIPRSIIHGLEVIPVLHPRNQPGNKTHSTLSQTHLPLYPLPTCTTPFHSQHMPRHLQFHGGSQPIVLSSAGD